MAEYGIPYMGSKDKICDELIKIFPKADNFYDLFGGGFSITHAMMNRRKNDYKHFHFNEIKRDVVELIKGAISGKYNYDVFKPEFIDRETFFKRINEAYIRVLWSFGNGQSSYLFSKEIEPYKKSMHNAIVYNDFDNLAQKVIGHDGFKDDYSINDRRLFLRNRIEYFRLNGIPYFLHEFLNVKQLQQLERLQQLQQLQQLQRLQQLQQLERLERLQQLEQLELYSKSYDEIEIKDNSIIYCDPPYKNTRKYIDDFDHNKFIEWAATSKHPIFISEYNISDDRFKLIKKINKRSMLSAKKENVIMSENVYCNQAGHRALLKAFVL